MARKKDGEPNYFASNLENYPQLKNESTVLKVVVEAIEKGSLYSLFRNLFFRSHELDILKLCDYLLDAYTNEYQEDSFEKLTSELQIFAGSLHRGDRDPKVIAEQLKFLEFIHMYLEAKNTAETDLRRSSMYAVRKIGSEAYLNLSEQEWIKKQAELHELIRNTAAVVPHSLLKVVSATLTYQQQRLIQLLQDEIIQKRNDQLGQDPF